MICDDEQRAREILNVYVVIETNSDPKRRAHAPRVRALRKNSESPSEYSIFLAIAVRTLKI